MGKKLTWILSVILVCFISEAFSQTITVGAVDPGPYGQGSTIGVPIAINDAGACLQQGNKFELYLSDATGDFTSAIKIGEYTGFYASFVNGLIPNGTPAGTGYKVQVRSTLPAAVSSTSAAFEISALSGTNPVITSPSSITPEVFGTCFNPRTNIVLTNLTGVGSTVTANLRNDQSGASSNLTFPTNNITPAITNVNYTLLAKSVTSGIVSTKGYQIVNNPNNTSFTTSGTTTICINGTLDFSVAASDLEKNFPGNVYRFSWGDGTSDTYTLCQIKNNLSTISHQYTQASCAAGGFQITVSTISPFCGPVGSPINTTAYVLEQPVNSFTGPAFACSNQQVVFDNTSNPGQSVGGTGVNCLDPNATYNWYVDGVLIEVGQPLSYDFAYTFTRGTHRIRLEVVSNSPCPAIDYEQDICVTDPPQPQFSLPSPTVYCTGSVITPTDLSVLDAGCSNANVYTWTVTGPSAVQYAGGTNANSPVPQFIFPSPGTYSIKLSIKGSSCDAVETPVQTIIVNATPTAVMSANAIVCGAGQQLTFDNNIGITRTLFTGTAIELSNTYTWTVTGGAYTFAGGTNANSKYPKILFSDLAIYTVSVTHTNNCGTETASQTIEFKTAPIVDAGAVQNICYGTTATLAGTITPLNSDVTNYQWVGGNGTFSPNRGTLNATYTPSLAEMVNGQVVLTLQVTTSIPSPCNNIVDQVTINIAPQNVIISASSKFICTGDNVNYTPVASQSGSTFRWTATGSTGASGYSASGTGNITDVLTNSNPTNNVTVSYTIIPVYNGCDGTPFVLTVTVRPRPVLTATPASPSICNNTSSAISLTSNIGSTTYKWTSVASSGITGNTNQATAISTAAINNTLINSGTTTGTVTYTIIPVGVGGCEGSAVVVVITVQPPARQAAAGADATICASPTYTLAGNDAAPFTGKWTLTSGQTGITFDDDTKYNAVASGLQTGQVYKFKWTITGNINCPTTSDEVIITVNPTSVGGTTAGSNTYCSPGSTGSITVTGIVGTVVRWEGSIDNGVNWYPITNATTTLTYLSLTQTTQYRAVVKSGVCPEAFSTPSTITISTPAVMADAGMDQIICDATTVNLSGNDPLTSAGLWTLTSGQTGITFDDATARNTIARGLIAGQVYTFRWTITPSSPCSPTSDQVQITINPASVGGTTSGSNTYCSPSTAGVITLSGSVGSVVRWERSINGGTTWTNVANTTTSLNYSGLTQTTLYRAVVKSGVCAEATSTVSTITVNPPAIAANAGLDQVLCNVTSYQLSGNDPLSSTGLWTLVSGQTGVTFDDATVFNTTARNLVPGQVYTFKWTITPLAPCLPTNAVVNISINPLSVGGTTAGSDVLCVPSAPGNITLSGHVGTVKRWESSIDGGLTWQTIINTSTTQGYNGLTQTTRYRAVVQSGVCAEAISSVSIITVNPPPVTSNAGTNQILCNATTALLNGNDPLTGTGMWTLTSGQTGITFDDASAYSTTVRGLTGGQVYTFKWTITGSSPCPPSSSTVDINNLNAVSNNVVSYAGGLICAGSTITIDGTTPAGGNGTYTYLWETSTDGITWTPISQNGKDIQFVASSSYSIRRTVTSGSCLVSVSLPIQIAPLPPIANNIITANQTICANSAPAMLNGSIPTGGNGGYGYSWQTSIDGGQTWNTIPLAVNSDYQPLPITQTTLYRRVVSSMICTGPNQDYSSPIEVTVVPNAFASFTWTSDVLCAPFTISSTNITAQSAPQNADYRWFANNTLIGTGITFPGYALNNVGESVTIRLEVLNTLGCGLQTFSHTFSTTQLPVVDFTPSITEGCGPLIVKFTNKTTNATGAIYNWDFGNGVTSTLENPLDVTFLPREDGRDTIYTVKLRVVASCITLEKTMGIRVSAKAEAIFSPSKTAGCSPLTVTFRNSSRGERNVYKWDFGDGSTLTTTDNADVTHTYITTTTKVFVAKLRAENSCGNDESQYNIRVTPNTVTAKLVVDGDELEGCAPHTVRFHNNSTGATLFTYNFGDGTTLTTNKSPETVNHIFTRGGKYNVTILATNGCSETMDSVLINVFPKPNVKFSADIQAGCEKLTVQFRNETTDGVVYSWDFGDGGKSSEINPVHTFTNNKSPYTVKLVATNGLGCSDSITVKNYIIVADPIVAQFNVEPGTTIKMPDNEFTFKDKSQGDVSSWRWDFGDGIISRSQDPIHAYADSGSYTVTLMITTSTGCTATISKVVRVEGATGRLFIPNAFIPASGTEELRLFTAKGSGMSSWIMTIYNKWGQVIWQTDKLNERGEPTEGWDGYMNGAPAPQGVYVWRITATFKDGTEWTGMSYKDNAPKRTGIINLIR